MVEVEDTDLDEGPEIRPFRYSPAEHAMFRKGHKPEAVEIWWQQHTKLGVTQIAVGNLIYSLIRD